MPVGSNGLLLPVEIEDRAVRDRAVNRLRGLGVVLPTFAQIAAGTAAAVDPGIDPDTPDVANLARINWFNDTSRRGRIDVPAHMVLGKELTGIDSPVLVLLGSGFPMIGAHKVLPAYAALVTRLVSGRFDPSTQRAVWPSTGNYCRGGVAVSRIMGCDSVAVLPAGMSAERFEWLSRWVRKPEHVIRTPGTESNVKEIYDKCRELETDPDNVILNQFADFTNYMVHHASTGQAAEIAFQHLRKTMPGARLAAFVSATGSAGTIAAGDALKSRHGSAIVAVEALECPTLLENGYGEHGIEGIGDKHVPLIHNALNLDAVVAVSDNVTDRLHYLFHGTDSASALAQALGADAAGRLAFDEVGLSGFANIAGAIRYGRERKLGADDVIVTVATDSSRLYKMSLDEIGKRHFAAPAARAGTVDQIIDLFSSSAGSEILLLDARERRRIFNLGYYTWVEQQGIAFADFEARRSPDFWASAASAASGWDQLIEQFNQDTGLAQNQRATR